MRLQTNKRAITLNTKAVGARDAILNTAERLFAEQGIEAVSLRTINTDAGYSVAALHYHFGNREGLIDELMQSRRAPIMQRRQALLDQLKQQKQPSLKGIANALVLPLAEPILADHDTGLRTVKLFFQHRLMQQTRGEIERLTQDSYKIFDALLAKALPKQAPKTLQTRWALASELALQGLANIDTVLATRTKNPTPDDYQHYIDELVHFIAGGLHD